MNEKNSNSVATVLHVALPADLEKAKASGEYVCGSLDAEGFIHCCLNSQLPGVLERYFATVPEYTVIEVKVDSLPEQLKPVFENTVGGEELFPHIYGALPASSYTVYSQKSC